MADGRERVYRKCHERYTDACGRQVDRWDSPSAMVWPGGLGCNISGSSLRFGVHWRQAVSCRDEILGLVVLPFLERVGGHAVFQQDNARRTHFLMENDFHVLPWPAVSPELIFSVGFPEHAHSVTCNPPTNCAAVEGLYSWKNRRPFHRSDVTAGLWGDGLLLSLTQMEVMWIIELWNGMCHSVSLFFFFVFFLLNKLARCVTHLLLCSMADVRIQ